ncbi:GNAT family N-acetyltransferase [Ureibacillus sp. FSL K6-8385]|uniref:GNAT family N-acetyltransferase n=1 Tax=Ureibacillus terrenus TaxID=118246 RepID=A0A540V358_9BACL|nr:GNAT family N-acetyltransferase [Ureibacillus terrenus]MED3662038.1 GNAT family N-acetyltransferase [Ureibacillus terrenus]MED3764683.1 GNAT family N-acetyltransferase [Ureibacillus terrenus]TQE90663.1 GNAT family N-acetyltransferase [Ureibacillus terrenus]
MIEAVRVETEDQLEKALAIRKEVFVQEQGVPEDREMDEYDRIGAPCRHVLILADEKAVGTGRIRFVEGAGKLERIAVLKPYRQMGIGKVIVQELEKIAKEEGCSKVKLHSQTHANPFYEKLGYQINSEVFFEEGIPHNLMVKTLD